MRLLLLVLVCFVLGFYFGYAITPEPVPVPSTPRRCPRCEASANQILLLKECQDFVIASIIRLERLGRAYAECRDRVTEVEERNESLRSTL